MDIRGEQAQTCDDDPTSKNDRKSKFSQSSQINPGSIWEGPRHQNTLNEIKKHQKTYSRTSKMEGSFELKRQYARRP